MVERVSLMKKGMFYISKGAKFIIGRGSQIFVKNISAETMAPCGENSNARPAITAAPHLRFGEGPVSRAPGSGARAPPWMNISIFDPLDSAITIKLKYL